MAGEKQEQEMAAEEQAQEKAGDKQEQKADSYLQQKQDKLQLIYGSETFQVTHTKHVKDPD